MFDISTNSPLEREGTAIFVTPVDTEADITPFRLLNAAPADISGIDNLGSKNISIIPKLMDVSLSGLNLD